MKNQRLSSRTAAILLACVLTIGLAVRIFVVLMFSMGPNFYSDENGYLTGAITFVNTGYISYADPAARTSATCVGMQLLLGGLIALFGYTPSGQIAAHIVFSCISLVTAGMAYLLVCRWRGRLAGLIAALLCTFEPGLMSASCVFLTETPFICLNLSAAYLLMRWAQDDHFPSFWGGVLCTIGSALFRGVGLMVLLIPAVILIRRRKSWRSLIMQVAAAVLAFVLVFTPWWVRNAKMYGKFVMFTTNSGDIQLMGSYMGVGAPEGTYEEKVVELDAEAWNEGYQDDIVRRFSRRGEVGKERLKEWFQNNPLGFLFTHLISKPFTLVTGHFMPIRILPEKLADIAWWICLLLAMYGIGCSGRSLRKGAGALIFYLLIGCLASAMFAPLARYGLPYVPLWLSFAACGISSLLRIKES